MRLRDLIFGTVAAVLLAGYAVLGGRLAPFLVPGAAATPAPARPLTAVPAPMVNGTIAFILRGDVFVLRNGHYTELTNEGRSTQPALSADGRTLYFSRVEQIDGLRRTDGSVVNAQLGFSNIVRKPSAGGAEEILLKGLVVQAPNRFHVVKWFLSPAVSPDGTTIVVTSYDRGQPQLLLKAADTRPSVPVMGIPAGEPYRASYSPDGKWLVYTLRHDDGRTNDVHAVEISTGKDVALTSDGVSWNGVFSPDGRQIAYLHAEGFTIDLWVRDVGDALSGRSPGQPFKVTHGEGVDGASRPAWGR